MKGVQILNFMGSSKLRVLVHKDMEDINVKDSVDIVLTPQFYTFLREDLEIKFAYQAKKIAPAFFDDYLNAGVEHQYHVYKHSNEWYFFAYSVEEITTFLEERGLSSHQIGKIYFAQELEKRLESPMELGETMVMQTLEGTVTLLPKRLLSPEIEYQSLNLQKEKFQNGIALSSSYDSIVPFKETALLSTLLFFLGSFFLFEGERGRSSIESLEVSQTELLEQYPKLSSSLQRNSEMKKYTKIDREERVKREALMQVSKMISNSNRLKSLVLNEKSITATIKIDSPVAMRKLKKLAKKRSFTLLNESAKEISVEKKL
jgi:hypothetical protein